MTAATSAAVGLAFILAQAAVGAANFGFHVVGSRMLGPADYGVLGSVLVVMTALTVPASVAETLVTARVAQALERGHAFDGARTTRNALAVGAVACAFVLAATPALADYLHLDSPAPLCWLALYCLPLSAVVVPWGITCGSRRFATAGGIAVCGAVMRLALAALFISAGWGVAGAIAASVCADLLRAALLAAVCGYREFCARGAGPLRLDLRHAISGIAGLAGLWLLIGIDTLIARHSFDPRSAGLYAVSATIANGIVLMGQVIGTLRVPGFATDAGRARRDLARTLGAACALGLCATAAFMVAAPRLLPLLLGPEFTGDHLLVGLLGLGATAVAAVWILLQFHLARGSRTGFPVWYGLLVVAVGAALIDLTPPVLAAVMVAGGVTACCLSVAAVRREPPPLPRPVPRPEAAVDLTVVVPFHNPGPLLRPNMDLLLAELRRLPISFEVIAVEDGCTDGSAATISDLSAGEIRCLSLPANTGKGAALRLGLREGRGRYVGFIDADGDIDPALWRPFLALLELYDPDAVVGSKCHPLSEIHPDIPWTRRLCSLGYRALVRALFPGLKVRDTQVGIKVFRRDVLEQVLPRTVERRFVFDLELLLVAHRLGYRRIVTAPVSLRAKTCSTITARAVWRMAVDTFALFLRARFLRAYDGGPARPAGRPAPTGTAPATHAIPPARQPDPAIAEVF